jgi:nuclear GTP-binding protein
MGQQKKEASRKERQGKTGDGMGNVKVKGENFYRYVVLRKLRHAKTNSPPALQRRTRFSSA